MKFACIPAYNEENTISDLVKTAKKFVDKVVVCDDGWELHGHWYEKLSELIIALVAIKYDREARDDERAEQQEQFEGDYELGDSTHGDNY